MGSACPACPCESNDTHIAGEKLNFVRCASACTKTPLSKNEFFAAENFETKIGLSDAPCVKLSNYMYIVGQNIDPHREKREKPFGQE